MVYETKCRLCKAVGKTATYIGETSRSLFKRQKEHIEDCLSSGSVKSHMKNHWAESHQAESGRLETIDQVAEAYEVKIVEKFKTALQRQIGEAIHIRRAQGTLFNDKEEYNRCELPMLSVSKQTQKVMTNSKDREIIEETEREQSERPETQFKRKTDRETERPTDEKETDRNVSSKKQKREVRTAVGN